MRLSEDAVRYGWRELARRTGVADSPRSEETGFEGLGISVHYGLPDEVGSRGREIVVVPCSAEDWSGLLELPPRALESIPLTDVLPRGVRLPLPRTLPVLFRGRTGEGRAVPVERREGRIVFHVDILAATIFQLSRWEETLIRERDEHDRVPADACVATRQGFLDRPIVDEYALILREWLRQLLPGWEPRRRVFGIRLSHDVDTIWPFPRRRDGLRAVLRSLASPSDSRLGETARQATLRIFAPTRSSGFRGIRRLARISRTFGMRSAFFFMGADGSTHDNGYRVGSRPVRRLISELTSQGFELGFHPGYRTHSDPARFSVEKQRLDRALGTSRYGGRQHFLRFRVPDTWRLWEREGLAYDSTLTFAEREGFRCGTCHPYRPFDFEQNRELDIWEVPLIVMDGTLHQYRRLSPADAGQRILELAERARAVEGTFTLLWHNSSLDGEWTAWARCYEDVVARLSRGREKNPEVASESLPDSTASESGYESERASHNTDAAIGSQREGERCDGLAS
jgi:hypothetical protein